MRSEAGEPGLLLVEMHLGEVLEDGLGEEIAGGMAFGNLTADVA